VVLDSGQGDSLLNKVARWSGGDIPKDLPPKYIENIQEVAVFNATQLWDLEELTRWEKRFDVPMEREPAKAFEKYFKSGHAVLGALVNHPAVPDAARFSACNIMLQRAAIVFDGKRETIVFRSYFNSADDDKNYVNFVPDRGVEASFASDTLFFPLALTRFISIPSAHVSLDILTPGTPKAPRFGELPHPLEVVGQAAMLHQGSKYHVTRIAGVLQSGHDIPDLNLRI
jgi:hypothetical protein